ncbi:hypothetical protein AvCA_03560 [Azotobacter vinelandii CA]|uniref:Uncharacterized protein n=2 Tax=Azotobacter vinelandii TaxID=354 RepID=C1DIB9_AZOVD|nr:hypothetical protein Avin_03560 [Azotobacter vinelandii DJ]AGK15634.1 hypothetical protein AvCA_03560 [Azotobacter vinelandii CA]AGK19242.1 hypothetical protein AvCA6_03560 [Azotobacter vinelandii CA6]
MEDGRRPLPPGAAGGGKPLRGFSTGWSSTLRACQ